MGDMHSIMGMHPKTKTFLLITLLIVIGLFVGIFLSGVSIRRARDRIHEIDPEAELKPGIPLFGMTLLTLNIFFLFALIYTHISIFLKAHSKFLIGLILFLVMLLIKSFFAYWSTQLLTIASALRDPDLPLIATLGFSGTGLGGILIFYHIFEFCVLVVFLYLIRE
ncbi:MAG: hypothetical protein JXA91_05060 [Candidatus Thermoplasmatota archaeon]|nr:hypothetical protein [Candidatus Thermoplasmatota archaeon]